MSITCSYRRLSHAEFAHIRADATTAASYFGDYLNDEDDDGWKAYRDARDSDGRYMNIGKAWHGLHFLLNGDEFIADTELANAVAGGMDTEWEGPYGNVRYLDPVEVAGVAKALIRVDEAQLRRRFDPSVFRAKNIYPGAGFWRSDSTDDLDWLLATLAQVRQFFKMAALSGEFVLQSQD